MIKIYHNPRCTKSRQALEEIKNSGKDFVIVHYLEDPFSKKELTEILNKLKMKPLELIRKNEAIWKEQYKGKKLSNEEVIEAMIAYPKLIERPIVTVGEEAVVGRPTDRVIQIIQNAK